MNITKNQVRIIGISLLKNEDHFAEWSLRNVLPSCDEFLVLDNQSTDQTRSILERLSKEFKCMKITDVDDPLTTHRYVEEYADTPTWVFGVDGDEIYDPVQFASLCEDLRLGKYKQWWSLDGQALNVIRLSFDDQTARGYFGPIRKLYNFSIIDSWHEKRSERLHGSNIIFKEGYGKRACKDFLEMNWNDACIRCLHLCFLPRSSNERSEDFSDFKGRPNPTEINKSTFLRNKIRNILGKPKPAYKRVKYTTGPIIEVSVSGFGGPTNPAAARILNRGIPTSGA